VGPAYALFGAGAANGEVTSSVHASFKSAWSLPSVLRCVDAVSGCAPVEVGWGGGACTFGGGAGGDWWVRGVLLSWVHCQIAGVLGCLCRMFP